MLLHEIVAQHGAQVNDLLTAMAELRSHVTDLHQQVTAQQERLTMLEAAQTAAAIQTAASAQAAMLSAQAEPRAVSHKGRR